MPRYIDADKLYDEIKSLRVHISGKDIFPEEAKESVLKVIDESETKDAQKVKHGKWINDFFNDYHCSECGAEAPNDGYDCGANYCYNCGAKMDGKKEQPCGSMG